MRFLLGIGQQECLVLGHLALDLVGSIPNIRDLVLDVLLLDLYLALQYQLLLLGIE
jgi:hypothetical protein